MSTLIFSSAKLPLETLDKYIHWWVKWRVMTEFCDGIQNSRTAFTVVGGSYFGAIVVSKIRSKKIKGQGKGRN